MVFFKLTTLLGAAAWFIYLTGLEEVFVSWLAAGIAIASGFWFIGGIQVDAADAADQVRDTFRAWRQYNARPPEGQNVHDERSRKVVD